MDQSLATAMVSSIAPPYRDAVYRDEIDPDPQLRGNAMAAVWPRPGDDLFKALRKRPPPRVQHFADLSLAQRLEHLSRLDDFHYPFEGEQGYLLTVISQVRKSYLARNATNPQVMRVLMSAAEGRFTAVPRLSEAGGGGGLGVLVTGISGAGKSCWVDRVQALYGQRPWVHKQINGRPCRWFQLGGIRVKVKRTWRATLEAIIQAIDFQLSTDYYSKREKAATKGRYENSVLAAATGHFAPYIILEDLDRIRMTDEGSKEILDGLIDLMEAAGLVIIVVGTVKLRRLFKQEPMYFAKFSSAGDIRFERLQPSKGASHFIKTLQSQSVSKNPIKFSADFEKQFLISTMGVRRIMRETMRCILTRHAHDESTVVDAKLLESIARDEMEAFQDCVGVLRQYDLGMPAKYEDYQAYEHFLPPEAVRLTDEQMAVIDQFCANRALNLDQFRSALTPDIYETLKQEQLEARTRKRRPDVAGDKEGKEGKEGKDRKEGTGGKVSKDPGGMPSKGAGSAAAPAGPFPLPSELDPTTLG